MKLGFLLYSVIFLTIGAGAYIYKIAPTIHPMIYLSVGLGIGLIGFILEEKDKSNRGKKK